MRRNRTIQWGVGMILLVAVAASASAQGRRGDEPRRRPPARPIADAEFEEITVARARLYCIVIVDREVQSREAIDLGEGETSGVIAEGVLTLAPFELSSDEGPTVSVEVDEATLRRHRGGSAFRAPGTATIDGDEMRVRVSGHIHRRGEQYVLRATVRGVVRSDDGEGTRTFKILRMSLRGTAPAPAPEEEEGEEDDEP